MFRQVVVSKWIDALRIASSVKGVVITTGASGTGVASVVPHAATPSMLTAAKDRTRAFPRARMGRG